MADRINILDEVLASKIAAGEVVERPSSVVKELVENSIDAGADRIAIEVHSGGKSLILVTDNGCGMSERDAALSVERHATSKLRKAEDLFNISTLGFRGEALAAVSSISRFELLTNDGDKGTKIYIEGGKTIEKEECACPRGTTIIVKDLFYNTPARLKYMKGDQTESTHISDIVSKLVLSNPKVSFKLVSNGKEVISSSGNGNVLDAIASIYGNAFAKSLVEVDLGNIKGYVSKPSDTKVNKDYQLFFVNGRYVRNLLLSNALESSYRNLISKDRHPAGILFVSVDPGGIDVNVHPAKREVKFADPGRVIKSISEAVKHSLIKNSPAKMVYSPDGFVPPERNFVGKEKSMQAVSMCFPEEFPSGHVPADMPAEERSPVIISSSEDDPLNSAAVPVPVAQVSNTYIVCVDGRDIVLIDQHAAHERILYEKIKSGKISRSNSQVCLMPQVIALDKKEFSMIEKSIERFLDLGFDLEVFGSDSIRVKAVPSDMTNINVKKLLSDLALEVGSGAEYLKTDEFADKIAKLAACHGAIKAGDRLSDQEMRSLVRELFATSNFSTCPHGRPSVARIDDPKIARLFSR